ncbi:hypothetical protein F4774DRAFT_409193 [Daldinia eschscholtzii]|nr:hypothetical protein F4774DRAFT_409193 [Daldinia eschscholtzii]
MRGINRADLFLTLIKFHETPEAIPDSLSDLFTSYSSIPKDDQIEHVVKIRDGAYDVFPYPCLGAFLFLKFNLSTHPSYQEHVLSPLKQPFQDSTAEPLFLDLGTCFGQDLRKLAYDGALTNRIWASDIDPEFIELGFQLFNDSNKLLKDHFLCPGNLLSRSPEDRLGVLDDKVTILHASHIFHLFSLEEQKTAIDRCLRLLRKDTGKPVLTLGIQAGSTIPTASLLARIPKYIHNDKSWQELWHEVCGNNTWRDRIKTLDVKSELHKFEVESGTELAWQIFEIWVTFV